MMEAFAAGGEILGTGTVAGTDPCIAAGRGTDGTGSLIGSTKLGGKYEKIQSRGSGRGGGFVVGFWGVGGGGGVVLKRV